MNIAIVVDNLLPSDLTHKIIKNVNNYKICPTDDLSVYIEDVAVPCIDIHAPITQIFDLFSFYGITIGTSLNVMGHIMYIPNPSRRIYYMYDYEWCRQKYPFRVLEKFFHSDVEIITHNEQQKEFISKIWFRDKKEVLAVIPDFNLEEIVRVLKNER